MGEYGTKLASYLVNKHKWRGIYYNPDVNHPRDRDLEHPYSYYRKVLLSKRYYEIPISRAIIDYKPTPKTDGNYRSFSKIGASKEPTVKNMDQLEKLKKIKFAVGVSRGGKHTWLYSSGKVHWNAKPSLYEATDFEKFPWLSGALVVPPATIAAVNANKDI